MAKRFSGICHERHCPRRRSPGHMVSLPTGREHSLHVLWQLLDGLILKETRLLIECGRAGQAGSGVDAHGACSRNPSAAQLPSLIHYLDQYAQHSGREHSQFLE